MWWIIIGFSWLSKQGTKNPINQKDSKRFQQIATGAFNHEEIKKDPQKAIYK